MIIVQQQCNTRLAVKRTDGDKKLKERNTIFKEGII